MLFSASEASSRPKVVSKLAHIRCVTVFVVYSACSELIDSMLQINTFTWEKVMHFT